jgi:hypothetical protein
MKPAHEWQEGILGASAMSQTKVKEVAKVAKVAKVRDAPD